MSRWVLANERKESFVDAEFWGNHALVFWQLARKWGNLWRNQFRTIDFYSRPLDDEETKRIPPELVAEGERRVWGAVEAEPTDFVLTLGLPPARAFFPGWEFDDLLAMHGRPIPHEKGFVVLPTFSPHASMFSPEYLGRTMLDLQEFAKTLRTGSYVVPRDGYPDPSYTVGWGSAQLKHTGILAIDTEGWYGEEWSLQYTTEAGKGEILRADDHEGIEKFKAYLRSRRPVVLFHNFAHDDRILRAIGVDVVGEGLQFEDTLVGAFTLQGIARGLKPLARRVCGMSMGSFAQLVGPDSERLAVEYAQRALDHDKVEPWPAPEDKRKWGTRRYLSHMVKRAKVKREYWEEWGKDLKRAVWQQPVVEKFGPLRNVHMDDVDPERFKYYAGRDPDATIRIAPYIFKRITNEQLMDVYRLDRDVLPYFRRMAEVGLPLDLERNRQLHEELSAQRAALTSVIRLLAEEPNLNPNSPPQLSELLFRKLQLPEGRLTNSGVPSTDDKVLNSINDLHPIIPLIMEFREVDKIDSTFVRPLPGLVYPDGRIRPDWRLTSVFSGRVATSQPNVLSMPAKTKLGKRARWQFVAPPGYQMGSADLSQIELRLIAHLSRDPEMIDAFRSGLDFHVATAAKLFGKKPEDVDHDLERYPTKTINYLVSYGGEEWTMYQNLVAMGITRFSKEDCGDMIRDWFKLYKNVAVMQRTATREAMERGYVVEPLSGRRRYLPGASIGGNRWPFRSIRKEAIRQAFNHKIQGAAATLLKRAQIRLWREGFPHLRSQGIQVEPWLQMHDELGVEFAEGQGEAVRQVVIAAMTAESNNFRVPILADWHHGRDWSELK